MAGRIPQEFITQLLETADIIDILSQKIDLKRKGKSYKACCPFHHEKTPSFNVSQDKQVYHCFGCGASGSTLQFLMDYDNLTFVDAVEELARFYHQEVPREQGRFDDNNQGQSSYQHKQTLSNLLLTCSKYYQKSLKNSQIAQNYLSQRGLDSKIIEQFQLGFSLDQWNQVDRLAPKEKEDLIKAGMLIRSDKGSIYDRFRNRIMFPIINKRGLVIGFGGRSLDNEQQPKYLNSPDSPTFDKSKELYGLYQTIQTNRQAETLIIVEGYMDVIALAQYGIPYAIASLGTATSAYQIKDALRNCNTLIFCYDGDSAGQKAAWRAAETSLGLMKDNLDIRFIILPEKDDPDSYTQNNGKEAFEKLIKNAPPLDEFILQNLKTNHNSQTLSGKTAFTDELNKCFTLIPEGTYKNLFAEKISKNSAVELTPKQRQPMQSKFTKRNYQIEMSKVRKLISYLIKSPKQANYLIENKDIFKLEHKGMSMLAQICMDIIDNKITNQAALLSLYIEQPYFNELNQIANWQPIDNENNASELQDIVNKFHTEYLKVRKKLLFDKLTNQQLDTVEQEELKVLNKQLSL